MKLPSVDTDKVISIARKHGAVTVSVFGSFARGNPGPTSDLDILVEFEPGRSLFDLVRLERELSDVLGLEIEVVTPNSLHPLIRERVMEERVPIL